MSFEYIEEVISNNGKPITVIELVNIFTNLGLSKGDIVIAHISLRSMGYIVGGAETVFNALMNVLGDKGTIVVPSQTVEISDPKDWQYPPVPKDWIEIIKENLPPYNPKTSYSSTMGEFSNFIRMLPESNRSNHPMYSFSAIGNEAIFITSGEKLDFPFGKGSPLDKLYNLNAKVLLVGTDFESNTSIHFAESIIGRESIKETSKVVINGKEKWETFLNVDLDIYDDYLELQESFFNTMPPKTEIVYGSKIYCFSMKDCVDYAVKYYQEK